MLRSGAIYNIILFNKNLIIFLIDLINYLRIGIKRVFTNNT